MARDSVMRKPREENEMKNLYATEKFFDDLFGFRREFDEKFNRILGSKPWGWELPEFKNAFKLTPAAEVYVDKVGKKYVCRMPLPGITLQDVQVYVEGNLLTIKGERRLTHRAKETEMFEEEIAYGAFERTFNLPEGVSYEKLNAEYVNGVLEITAPVAAVALPRKIEIKTSVPLAKQIAA
jgi:HSP20 family protein